MLAGMTEVLYARISDENIAWLRAMAADTGLALAKIVDLVCDEARQHEWAVSKPALTRKESAT